MLRHKQVVDLFKSINTTFKNEPLFETYCFYYRFVNIKEGAYIHFFLNKNIENVKEKFQSLLVSYGVDQTYAMFERIEENGVIEKL
jgi:hypothetical protein